MRALRPKAGALWILMLVFLAGVLNAAGWMAYGYTLSHMTGNLTKFGLSMSQGNGAAAGLIFVCVLCFFAGATVSGCGFPKHSPGMWQRCGVVLMLCGGILTLVRALPFTPQIGAAALSLVLGAQNGLAVRWRGTLMRTTHMTGHLTDCGAALGRMMHTRNFGGDDLRLFLFHGVCLFVFVLGVWGASLWQGMAAGSALPHAMQLGAWCYLLAGAATWAYSLRQSIRVWWAGVRSRA